MENKKAVFILGLKWWDKVNGNTYNNPVIFFDNGERYAVGFGYGYGDAYRYDAEKWLKENNIESITGDYNTLPHASKWTKKVNARHGYVYAD